MEHMDKHDYETLGEFRYALRLFLSFSQQAAAASGLSPQAYQALLAIKGYPGREEVSVGELAEKLQIRPHSAVGLLDRMEAQKLVKRRQLPEDRRQVRVTLTAKGAALLEKLASAHRDELRRVGPHVAALLKQVEEAM